jgi:NAD(P)H-hydrate repair Nnr-like enzyme with NAD(P)H-hydrate epimerase domain
MVCGSLILCGAEGYCVAPDVPSGWEFDHGDK